LELSNVSSIQPARRLLEEVLPPKMSGRHLRIGWKGKILYQDSFTDPSIHNQARRRISWRRWLRQVNEAIWRRLNDVKLEPPQELVVLMTHMGLPSSFGTQRRILESRKDLSMDVIKKALR
jgi:hypothetical protein